MKLTLKQRFSFLNHAIKVLRLNHHTELRPLLEPYIAEDATVFDVGGHAGQFTKLFSKMVPKGRVFAFEPSIYSRSILQIMVGIKFLANVFVLPFGLSNHPMIATIHTPVKKKGSLGYGLAFVGSAKRDQRELVSSEILLSTLDKVVDALGIERLDFIKADIEGSELLLLQGAECTLKKYKPTLLLEIDDNVLARNEHSGRQLVQFLGTMGYSSINKIDIDGALIDRPVNMNEETFNGDYLFTIKNREETMNNKIQSDCRDVN